MLPPAGLSSHDSHGHHVGDLLLAAPSVGLACAQPLTGHILGKYEVLNAFR